MNRISFKSLPRWALLLLALHLPSAEAGVALDRIRATGRIVIAHRDASVPFSYVMPDGTPVGYAVDLCRKLAGAISTKLGLRSLAIAYLPVTSASRISIMEEGKADLECESTTNTAERRTRVAFAIPHYITGARILVRESSQVSELGDFAGKRLAATTGTGPLKALQRANLERLLRIVIVEVPDHVNGVAAVESGEVDGFAMDEVLLRGLMSTRSDPSRLKVVGKYLTVEPLAIILPKGDAELKLLLDDEMKRLIRTKELHALHDLWFLQPIPPTGKTLGLQMPYLLRDFWKYPTDWLVN